MKTLAIITCPACGQKHREQMFMNSLVKAYRCRACGQEMVIGDDECCVFCVYSNRHCLSRQREWRDSAMKKEKN